MQLFQPWLFDACSIGKCSWSRFHCFPCRIGVGNSIVSGNLFLILLFSMHALQMLLFNSLLAYSFWLWRSCLSSMWFVLVNQFCILFPVAVGGVVILLYQGWFRCSIGCQYQGLKHVGVVLLFHQAWFHTDSCWIFLSSLLFPPIWCLTWCLSPHRGCWLDCSCSCYESGSYYGLSLSVYFGMSSLYL